MGELAMVPLCKNTDFTESGIPLIYTGENKEFALLKAKV